MAWKLVTLKGKCQIKSSSFLGKHSVSISGSISCNYTERLPIDTTQKYSIFINIFSLS